MAAATKAQPDDKPQDGESQEPQDGTNPSQSGQSAEPPEPQDGTDEPQDGEGSAQPNLDPEALQRELAETRRRSAEYRRKLREKEEQEAQAQREAMTELDRLKADNEALTAEVARLSAERKQEKVDRQVFGLAPSLNLVDPEVVARLIDRSEVEFDDDSGNPTNVEALVKEVIRTKPYLVQGNRTSPPQNIGGTSGAQAGPAPKLTADELKAAEEAGIDPNRYAALKNVRTLDDWQRTRQQTG